MINPRAASRSPVSRNRRASPCSSSKVRTGTWSTAFFLALFGALGGLAVGQVVVGIGTCMADIADENELHSGLRQEGVFFGASAFANKTAAGVGNLLAGIVLEWIRWPVGEQVKSAADIPTDTLVTLAVVAGPIASLLVLPGILCFLGYRLNRAAVAEIQQKLGKSSPQPVSTSA